MKNITRNRRQSAAIFSVGGYEKRDGLLATAGPLCPVRTLALLDLIHLSAHRFFMIVLAMDTLCLYNIRSRVPRPPSLIIMFVPCSGTLHSM